MLYKSPIDTVGNTPCVRIRNIANNNKSTIYIKLEFLNIGGSHKSRVAFNMIKDAEDKGILKPGSNQTILEPTGGNTGVGLAIAGAFLGYKIKLVMPDNYSLLKQNILRNYGADVILSDRNLGNNSHLIVANDILRNNPDYIFLDQFSNPANPEIHKKTTAIEIINDIDHIDYFVGGIGSGGSITGIGEVLKLHFPDIKIFGVQPDGCDLLKGKFIPHKIQAISVGILPKNLNVNILDGMISVTEKDVFQLFKNIVMHEGLSIGYSSSANIVACLKLANQIDRNINIVTLAYDSGAFYL